MGLGSIVMWLGVPLGLVFAASRLADTSAPTLGPYLLVFIGLPIGMAVMAKLLGYLDRVHQMYTRTADDRPVQAPGCARCAASGARPASAACSTR